MAIINLVVAVANIGDASPAPYAGRFHGMSYFTSSGRLHYDGAASIATISLMEMKWRSGFVE